MKKSLTPIVSLLSMVVVISLARQLDIWIDQLRRVARQNFNAPFSWLVPSNIAILLIAGLVLVWLWFVYKKAQNFRGVAILYILVGLGLLFYNTVAIALTPRLPMPMQLMIIPQSLSAFVSAVVAIVGFERLFIGKVAP